MKLNEIMDTSHRHFDGYPGEEVDNINHEVYVELDDGNGELIEVTLNVAVEIQPAEYDRGHKYANGDFTIDEVTFKEDATVQGHQFKVGSPFPEQMINSIYDSKGHTTIEDFLRAKLDGEVDVG